MRGADLLIEALERAGTEIVFGRTRGETGVVGAVVELLMPAGPDPDEA